MTFHLYNTITKKQYPFIPSDASCVTFYSCGPTVYDDAHIGNFRSFLAADLLRRWIESPLCTLQTPDGGEHSGPREVIHVMNITDVGHMTDDHNADGAGQDKMELAAQRITESKKDGSLHKAADIDPSDPRAIADFYEARFKKDAIALGLKVAIEAESDPTLMPRASDHVEHMKQVIVDLLTKDFAYAAGTPGARAVYFNTQTFPNYGQLSGNTLENLKGGAGGRVDESQQSEKKHPADFLLWKEDNTHKMKWSAPAHPDCAGWEDGYPGWHIECTAMALARLIPGGLDAASKNHSTIDLHSGGEDNIFPHHECEIAQSCCFTGQVNQANPSFARHWFHARFLKVEGEKMSKSKGTMYTLSDLKDKGYDSATVRLELIKTHYRSNADFSMQGLKDSAKQIEYWRQFARLLIAGMQDENSQYWTKFYDKLFFYSTFLANDLNISATIGFVNRTISDAKILYGEIMDEDVLQDHKNMLLSAASKIVLPTEPINANEAFKLAGDESINTCERSYYVLHVLDNILGVIFRPHPKTQDTGIALYQPGVTPSPEIESLLAQRAQAKKAKDFAAADAIRDQLTAMNLTIMDKPGGKVEVAPAN